MTNSLGYSNHARSRLGFSAIELMMVFSIGAVLSTLTIAGITRSMRAAAIKNASTALYVIANDARLTAINMTPNSAGTRIGVVIRPRPDGSAEIARSILNPPADIVVDAQGVAGDSNLHRTAAAVQIMTGDDVLSAPLFWYYKPGSGELVDASDQAISVGLGLSAPDPAEHFGALSAANPSDLLPTSVAPPSVTNPGLWFTSRDRSIRRAITITPLGFCHIETMED